MLNVLFTGDKCYTGNTLQFLQTNGSTFTIQKQLIPRKTLNKHYFVGFLDLMTDKLKSDVKHLINPFIGMLGQKHFDSVNIHHVCNMIDAGVQ